MRLILKLFIHIHSALRILHNTLLLEYVGEVCFRLFLTFVNYPKQRQVDVQLRPLSREESLRRSASAVSFFKVAQGMCRHVAEIQQVSRSRRNCIGSSCTLDLMIAGGLKLK